MESEAENWLARARASIAQDHERAKRVEQFGGAGFSYFESLFLMLLVIWMFFN